MLRKLSALFLLSISMGVSANAQQLPTESKEPTEKRANRIFFESMLEGSYLGVQAQEISKENYAKFGLNEVRGVGIEKVFENSPAAKAGLQSNDVVIKFNGENVTSINKLTRLINEVAPDHQAKITVLRGGSEREINVTLGKREMPKFQNGEFNLENLPALPAIPELPNTPLPPMKDGEPNIFIFRSGANRQIGIGVSPLTKQLGIYFGVTEGNGLLINDVREDSPAAKAGLKAGDVIIEVDGKQVNERFDLVRALNDKKEGDVALTIVRNRNRQTISVAPETVKGETMKPDEFEKIFQVDPNQMNFQLKTPKPQVAPFPLIFKSPRVL